MYHRRTPYISHSHMAVTVSKLTEGACDTIEFSVSINRHAVYLMALQSGNIWNGLNAPTAQRLPHTVGLNYRKNTDYTICNCSEQVRKNCVHKM